MKEFWSATIRDLSPYVPGEQPRNAQLIKLNTNENPYPPSPQVLEALRAAANADLRRYPDPEGVQLRQTIANMHALNERQVFLGNGSDEVLAHTFYGLLKHKLPILFPDLTYSFYPIYCELYDIAFERVPLNDDFVLNLEAFPSENGGVVLPNPNAPTGRGIGLDELRRFLDRNTKSVVVIDEAYVDFGADSAVPLISDYENLLLIQTISKSRSLAGMRVGFALGSENLIDALNVVKGCFNSYPLDRLALAGAQAALEDEAYFNETTAKICRSRERLSTALGDLGFEVLPSLANFVFARHPAHSGGSLEQRLRENDILVRRFEQPRIADYLRITVGTDEEIDALLNVLQAIG